MKKDYPHIMIVSPPSGPICDFCSSPLVRWKYPARDHVIETRIGSFVEGVHESIGEWAACDICSGFIDREDWAGLEERSVRKYAQKYKTHPSFLREDVRALHKGFRENRSGPKKETTPMGYGKIGEA